MKHFIPIILLCIFTLFNAGIQAQDANGILYVKKGGTGTGASWADPLGELADALRTATQLSTGTVKQIWVAAGIYLPMYPANAVTTGSATTTDRTNAFVLVKDVKIYGGFAGTETVLTSRDSSRTTNQTILSGNLGDAAVSTDNACHVVIGAGAVGTSEINSVIIRDGNGVAGGTTITVNGISLNYSIGAGMICYGSAGSLASPIVANVTITANGAGGGGGGMYCLYAAPVLNSVIISGNTAFTGAGMFNTTFGTPVLNQVLISGNTASGNGGGMCNSTATSLAILKNVTVSGNEATTGGGVYNANVSPSFTNVLMSGNKATNGGGMYNAFAAAPVLTNVTVAGNVATASGGGLYYSSTTPVLYNCIIYGNSASGTAGVYPSITPSITCQYSLIQAVGANTTYHILDGSTVNPAFTAASTATAPFTDGDYSLQSSSPVKNVGNDALYTAISGYPTTDLAGSARFNGTIDLGAYEVPVFQPQTITALADTTVTYGDVFTRAFSASSGLAVSLSSADNNIAEVYQDAGDNNIWKIKAKKVGSVVITMSQAGDANYASAADKNFTLTVNQADLTVTANGSLITYTGAAFSGGSGVTYTGFVNGDDSTAALTGTLTYSGTSQGASSIGIYAITPGGLNAANYNISYTDGSLSIGLATDANGVLFVKKGSTGNGSSWADATGEVADALRAAAITNRVTAGTVKQIWVAKGGYLPMYPANNVTGGTATTTNRINAFVLLKDVKMYGGFAGTETDTTARDFTNTANASILSGDLGTAGDNSDNAFHVLLAGGSMGNAIISGFTVTGGNANDNTGTISVNGYSFTKAYGGGLGIGGAVTLLMEDMIISDNTAQYGGAMAANGTNASSEAMISLRRVNILNNTSLYLGGGMYLAFAGVDIDSANIRFNTCDGNSGGGMFVSATSTVNGTRLHVNDNKATGPSAVGGGIYVSNLSVVNMTNSELLRDTATISGALLYINSTAPHVFKNVKMSGGYSGGTGPVVYCSSATNTTFINALITGNKGVAVYTTSGTHNFINATISGNGTGIYPFGGTVNIRNSIIYGNTTVGIQSGSATVSSEYSIIQGATDDAANHITSADPLFRNPSASTAPFTNGDYSLQSSSPVRDAGSDVLYTAVSGYPTTDLAGAARFNGTIDQGTYEANMAAQTIAALADTSAAYGTTFTRVFKASSGLAVTVASADNAIAQVYQDAADGNKWKIKAIKAGTVSITVSQGGDANYAAASNVVFVLTIDKASLTVTARDTVKVYDGITYSGGNGVTYNGFVNGEDSSSALTGTIAYVGNSQSAKDVNTYAITPSGLLAANYDITYADGTLAITKAALTITATNDAKTYDGLTYSGGNGVTFSGFVNGEDSTVVLTGTVAYGGSSQSAKDANTYTITPSGLSAVNYDISYASGTLTISKAALTITATNDAKTYDGLTYSGGNGVTFSGFVNGEDSTAVLTGAVAYGGNSQSAKDVNTYTITPSGLSASNYNVSYADGTLDISKAALTITAKNDSKTYDGLSYTGGNGVTFGGFVNGEDSTSALTGTVAYGGSSQSAKDVNSYAITPSGLSAVNYTINYTNGTLTISKAALTITATNDAKIYDGLTYSGGNGVTFSGFVNGEDSTAVLTGAVSYGGNSQSAKDVNTYAITPSGLSAVNYAINYTNGTLTISKAALTITAKNDTKTYDGLTYSGGNGVTFSGFVNGEDSTTVLTGAVSYGGNSQSAKDVNTYTISPSGLSASNYNISYADGTLDITKAALTITAKNDAKIYDGLTYSGGNGVTFSGFVNGEDSTIVLTGAVSYGGNSQSAQDVNTYTITPSGLSAVNYDINYASGTLTISKAILTITAKDDAKIYDGLTYTGGNGVMFSGFVNGEDSTAVLTGAVSYGGNSQSAKNVNTYAITPSGLSAVNYDINYASGTLTISKAALTITAKNDAKIYDGLTYSGGNGVTFSGFVNGEDSTTVLTGAVSYGGNSQSAQDVNTYAITPSGLSAVNYDISYASGTLTISKAILTITAKDDAKIYDGLTYTGGNGVTFNGFVNGEDSTAVLTGAVSYGGNSQSAQNVNTYTITPSGLSASNYNISYADGTLDITKAALTITATNDAKIYDGLTYSGGNGVTFSGFVNGEDSTAVLTGAVSYGGSSQSAKDVNTYAITPSGLSAVNYDISYASGTLTISKAALTITATNDAKIYDGLTYSGGNGVTFSGFVNGEDSTAVLTGAVSYGGSSQSAQDVNTYTITPSGLSAVNYDISYASGTLTINKAALTITATNDAKIYDGLTYSGGNGVTFSGFVNGEDSTTVLTGAVSYGGNSQSAKDVNAYTITPFGLSAVNYDINYVSGTLTISKAILTITAKDDAKIYDGLTYSGGNGVTFSGFVNGEDSTAVLTGIVSYGGNSQSAKDVNTYTITPSGLSAVNYAINYTNGTLIISKAALTITAKNDAKIYDGLTYSGGNGITFSGFVNGEDSTAVLTGVVSYGGNSQSAKDVNTYAITPSGLSAVNYDVSCASGILTIRKAALTITAKNDAKTYDGLTYSGGNGVTFSGFVNGEDSTTVLTGAVSYGGNSQSAKDVNTYAITPSGLSAVNYNISYASGILTISKAALTITAKNDAKIYDGLTYSGGNGVTFSGFVNGEDSTTVLTGAVSYGGNSQSAQNVNTYTISPSGLSASNYAISYANGTLNISKAALTITARNDSKTYDGLTYTGGNGVTFSGFVNGEDSAAVLTGAVTYSGTSQNAKNVNSYTISPAGLSASNYIISYANGTLTISKATLTITAKDDAKTYDGLTYNGGNGVTFNGFVNGENATAVLTGTVAYGGSSQAAKDVNTYTIIPSGLSAVNYAINYTNGTLNITKAALTITAKSDSKTYDGLTYSGGNGVTFNGFVNGEDPTATVTGSITYNGTSQGAKNVNTYVITPAGLIAGNYSISYISGTLTINKALVAVKAVDTARCYGVTNPTFRIVYNGLAGNETETVFTAAAIPGTVATVQSVAGSYPITVSGAVAENYDFSYSNGSLMVNALPVSTVSATAGTVLCGVNGARLLSASGNYSFEWKYNNTTVQGNATNALLVSETGAYTAIATDNNGCVAPAANNVTVTRLLPAQPAFGFDTYCAGTPVQFTNTTNTSGSGAVSYYWNSGDGQNSSNASPRFTYKEAGNYTAAVTVTPDVCPSLAATVTKVISVEAPAAGTQLATVHATSSLPTSLTARLLPNAAYGWSPATGLSNTYIYNPATTLRANQVYNIRMDFPSGCVTVDTMLVIVLTVGDVLVPNVFTPNGDGQNDFLFANLRGVKQLNYFRVLNRWGKKVFETADASKGWDGRFNGELQPLDTYVWTAEGVDENGRVIHRQGSVTLLR